MALSQKFKYLTPCFKRFNFKNVFSKIIIVSVIFYILGSTIYIIQSVESKKRFEASSSWIDQGNGYHNERDADIPNLFHSNEDTHKSHNSSSRGPKRCGYENCYLGKKDKLNVHIISHTHDDIGWIKTVTEYYYDNVQFILETTTSELDDDPSKRFIYVEMGFFQPWWSSLDNNKKQQVHKLVNSGQLEFILGGWSMNDEASTHYTSIIDQHTLGFDFLRSTFGECAVPRIGWQIDPFGHSREQASLFAQFGFDAFINSRIDWQDYNTRLSKKNLEDMWYTSDSLEDASPIYTHSLYRSTYSHPDELCFECGVRVRDNPQMENYNLREFLDNFISHVRLQRVNFQTNHIMVMMGGDFEYQNAKINFKNIDILLKHLRIMEEKENLDIHTFYSTPSCYVKAVNEAGLELQAYHGDYFPYSSKGNFYWTGYYTSRPSLKLYERQANSLLQTCKQIHSLTQLHNTDNSTEKLNKLKRAVAVLQHHDAITGTSKRYVAINYAKLLSEGVAACQEVVALGLKRLMTKTGDLSLQHCPLLNVSMCQATEAYNQFAVVVYNPLGWRVHTYVRLPVVMDDFEVINARHKLVHWQLSRVQESTKQTYDFRRQGTARYELIFQVSAPPLGFSTYFVTASSLGYTTPPPHGYNTPPNNQNIVDIDEKQFDGLNDVSIKNEHLQLTFDGRTGLLKKIRNIERSVEIAATHHILYYLPSENQALDSGAYVFHPIGKANRMGERVQAVVMRGKLVEEVRQVIQVGFSVVVRLYKGQKHFEVQWTLSPSSGRGIEYVSRIGTSLNSSDVFYTDANGRQMMQRVRNKRQSWNLDTTDDISSNYYPITNRIFIQDEKRDLQLTMMSDRSQGGSSLRSGQLELMIDRLLITDDGLGVDEALNDRESDGSRQVVRGTHYISLDSIAASTRIHRRLCQQLVYQAHLSFLPDHTVNSLASPAYVTQWKGLDMHSLPEHIHLLTLEQWHDGGLLLRLEHYWEKHEVATNHSVAVSLERLFKPFRITSLREQALGGDRDLSEVRRLQWKVYLRKTTSARIDEHMETVRDMQVILKPMQIRTFIVRISS